MGIADLLLDDCELTPDADAKFDGIVLELGRLADEVCDVKDWLNM